MSTTIHIHQGGTTQTYCGWDLAQIAPRVVSWDEDGATCGDCLYLLGR